MTFEKPLFIWGVGKSGSHLLYDVLSLHPSLVCRRVPHRVNKGLWGGLHWGEATPDSLRGEPIPCEGGVHFWAEATAPFFGSDGGVTQTIGVVTRERLSQEDVRRVRERYAALKKDWFWRGLRFRILDKTASYILMSGAIDAVFPDAYHIFCVRDPRAVLNSFLRVHRFPAYPDLPHRGRYWMDRIGFWAIVPPGYQRHQHEPLVKRLCWQIQELYKIGFASRRYLGDRLIEFRYESLLGDAYALVAALMVRLGLDPFPDFRLMIPPTFPDFSPPWPRSGIPPEEPFGLRRCYLDEECEFLKELDDFAVHLGYDPDRLGVLRAGHQPAHAGV